MKEKYNENIRLIDVFRAFWVGIKEYKIGFYFTIAAYALGNIVELINPLFYKRFFDVLTSSPDKAALVPVLIHVLIIILLLNILEWILYRSSSFSINYFEAHVMARLRQTSFSYMIDHSYSFFANNFSGSLVQRIGRFVRAFERLFDTLVFSLLPLIIAVLGTIIVIWTQQPRIAYIMVGWVIVVVAFSYAFSRWKLKYDVASAAADSKTSAYLSDTITNQNTVSSFAQSEYEVEGFEEVSNTQAKAMTLTWNLGAVMNAVQGAFVVVIEFALFYYAVKFWSTGIFTVGTFVLIQVYILNVAQKLWNLSGTLRTIYEGVADSKEMVDILMLPHEIKNLPGAVPIKVTLGKIDFENIIFNFNETRTVLDNIKLTVTGGEKIALIGPSGAGKSTVVKLLLRMYELTKGAILVDGQNIKEVTQESLRQNISLVPQEPILFHRTLMENIRYGKQDATDEEVVVASNLAHCDDFIDTLPLKYETFVGERGIKLSGGERQRVAIARAILKNAPILILDEATSSLDSHSEAMIQDALDKLMKGKTVIVIAHRLSTIRKMDRIVVLEKGKIIEEGTHEDLLGKKESLYKNLWSLQAGGFLAS
jgi:ATP-binding cassette subfamily B protein